MGKDKVGKRGFGPGGRKTVGDEVEVMFGRKNGRTGEVIGQDRRKKPIVKLENGEVIKAKYLKKK